MNPLFAFESLRTNNVNGKVSKKTKKSVRQNGRKGYRLPTLFFDFFLLRCYLSLSEIVPQLGIFFFFFSKQPTLYRNSLISD